MNRTRPIALLIAAVALQACDSPAEPDPGLVFEVVLENTSGYTGGFGAQTFEIVKDLQRWEAVWRTVGRQMPLPAIDFEHSMVVVAALGWRSTGGYDVDISRILSLPGEVRIEILATNPGGICPVTMTETWPVQAVVTERLDQPVIFTLTNTKRSC